MGCSGAMGGAEQGHTTSTIPKHLGPAHTATHRKRHVACPSAHGGDTVRANVSEQGGELFGRVALECELVQPNRKAVIVEELAERQHPAWTVVLVVERCPRSLGS